MNMKNISERSYRLTPQRLAEFGKNWGFFLAWGVALVILGMLAISFSAFTTLISVIFLGFLLLFSGVVVVIDSIQFWRGRGSSFFIEFLMGIFYCLVGLTFIFSPVAGSISLTLLLGGLFVVLGIFRIVYSWSSKLPRSGWIIFSGVITLFLGILILAQWPASGLFIIGLFVGIDLLFLGMNYIMPALLARKL
jgi:uncharacterized membrane protein HdeD (DUF308 family)